MKTTRVLLCAAGSALALGITPLASAGSASLEGWALMPAATFSDGPTSGQFASGNGASPLNNPPYLNLQPVQGFSGVLQGAGSSYRFLVDNGFGTQANSADSVLRMYAVLPDFRTATGGSGTVSAADWSTGAARTSFDASTRITLSDPSRQIGFAIQADYAQYYNGSASLNPSGIAVDASIRANKLLTGADFDVEGVRQDKNGNLWFGDEFGPFLVKTDATGRVLSRDVPMAGVYAPENPYRGSTPANLGSSRGFEGLAINANGDRLYTLLEGTVTGDPAKTLRINEFNIDTNTYTPQQWVYKLEADGTNIGDMTAINDHEFIVIERNGSTATSGGTPFKKLFKIDLNKRNADGSVEKVELVDLMNIADPNDLNGDGKTVFDFPYVTIENVHVIDANTLLVVNDNNFPGGGGRAATSDNTEFLKIHLDQALDVSPVPEPSQWALLLGGLSLTGFTALRRRPR
ncbi:MAG: PEP-CTERM sorting domain-containing protein [Roseateles depolymerans]|uniref:PEP-CTERM sorting domain-containing protein n=1 Tax=Roseateles depolymerans TaxID=76731 RepID=A0A2W5E1N5_9BURK|nr:MAG: PEP-CTERM sorting domain-containing protein [Roseateles depolymerans]